MTEPSGRAPADEDPPGQRAQDSWERRAAGVASEMQRWLIRTSARNMRDELGGQVKKALRGSERTSGDSWATATTEPPHAADEAPECAWCPVCRAARRIAQARAGEQANQPGGQGRGYAGPKLGDAADVMAGAVRDALAGLDAILSYRPGGAPSSGPAAAADASAAGEAPATPEATAGQARSEAAAGPADVPPSATVEQAGDQAGDQAERP